MAPILTRMNRSRQLKNADQILRRLVGPLEYPYAMQQMLSHGDFESVLSVYRRVQSLPASSGLRLLKRVSDRADTIMSEMKQRIVSILLAPTPVVPVLSRLVKLLHEIDNDDDGCRLILQQCFDKQLATFEDQLRSSSFKFSDNLLKAFMKGQEINLMNKELASPRPAADSSLPSRPPTHESGGLKPIVEEPVKRTAAAVRSAAVRRRQSQSAEALASEAMRSLLMFRSDDSEMAEFSPHYLKNEVVGNKRDAQDEAGMLSVDEGGDFAYEERDISDSVSLSDSASNYERGDDLTKQKDADDEDLYTDPHVDYTEIMCAKVRLTSTRSLIDLIDMWLPSLHRLLILLTTAPTSALAPISTPQPLPPKSSLPLLPARKVSGIPTVARSLQTTYGRNQSVAVPAKQLGDVLTTCSEVVRGIILGFKGTFSSAFVGEIASKPIFSQEIMQNSVMEPFLSGSVMEISEVYDGIETILIDKGAFRSENLSDDLDSANFFGSTAYRDSIHALKRLAEDGELTIAKKVMEQLMSGSLVLTSRAAKAGGASTRNPSELGLNSDSNSLEREPVSVEKVPTTDDIVRIFETAALRKLRRLVDQIRRPDWVSSTVWDSIQRLLDRFISSLAIMAGNNIMGGGAGSGMTSPQRLGRASQLVI